MSLRDLFRPSLPALLREAQAALASVQQPASPAQNAARGMSLAQFVRESWPIIEPSTCLVWGWALDAVCDHVQALLTGRLGRRNLIVAIPPGAMKSTIVSVCAPAWMWINRPQWRAIHASGNPTVSVRDSLRCRSILDSEWYRRRFGITWQFAFDQNLKTIYANSAGGVRSAVSSGSRITGSRADALFVDDALDAADAHSDNARAGMIAWWRSAYANRLNDMLVGTRCVIQQRLHPEDLVGWILGNEPEEWELLLIPQEWEESRRFTTSLGWTDPRTEDGVLMFPERFPLSVVNGERIRLGESGFAGQHQQRPFLAEGEIFKQGCLQLWPAGAELPSFRSIVLSLDTAFKEKETSDFSVGFAIGEFDKGFMLLDRVRGRFGYPALKMIVTDWAQRWRPSAVLIEDAASGQSLLQDLKQSTALPIVPVRPDGDKVARAHTTVPLWESCRVFAPAGAAWIPEFLAELHAFPKSPHDDQVDAMVQGLRHFSNWRDGRGLFEHYRREAENRAAAS